MRVHPVDAALHAYYRKFSQRRFYDALIRARYIAGPRAYQFQLVQHTKEFESRSLFQDRRTCGDYVRTIQSD